MFFIKYSKQVFCFLLEKYGLIGKLFKIIIRPHMLIKKRDYFNLSQNSLGGLDTRTSYRQIDMF